MIVRNEEFFLEKHLPQLRPSIDELVVVDTGSTDRTVEIAEKYADRLLHFDWVDDFSKPRNVSLQAASGDWILVLDADEIITPEGLERLRETAAAGGADAYTLPRYNYSNNVMEPGWQRVKDPAQPSMGFEGYTTHNIVRLVRRTSGWLYRGKVHELLEPEASGGAATRLDVPIHHYEEGNPDRPRLARRGEYLRLLESELEADPGGDILELAGRTYMYHEQEFERAIICFRKCLAMDHAPDRNRQNLAEALYRNGEIAEAKNLYEGLFAAGCRNFAVCLNLANLRVRAGETTAALACLRLALEHCRPGSSVHGDIEKNIRFLESRQ